MKESQTPSQKNLPPPTRNGVGPSSVVLPEEAWPTIAEFLIERFPGISADVWETRLCAGDVIDARGVPVDRLRRYEPQARIYYYRALEA